VLSAGLAAFSEHDGTGQIGSAMGTTHDEQHGGTLLAAHAWQPMGIFGDAEAGCPARPAA
ncbi:MAG: hypothetical protein PHX24_04655, partial [Acidithiobacillus sp.]|nr:hypothetical protein [Acidithiobacillus sp.]